MQYSHINKILSVGDHKWWSNSIKLLIFFSTCLFLWYGLEDRTVLPSEIFKQLFFKPQANYYILGIVFFLLPVNWGLEALKWQYLVKKSEGLSFLSSFQGVLSGVTLGFVTPHGIGDYAGRLLQLHSKNRLSNVGYLFFNRFAQLYVTLILGALSLIYLLNVAQESGSFQLFACTFFVLIVNGCLVLLLLFHKKILNALKRWKWSKGVYSFVAPLRKLSLFEVFLIFFYSTLRYAVFSAQFVFLLYYFGLQPPLLHLFMGVAFIFMAKSIFPTFFDFGVREAAAVFFFSGTAQMDQVLAASISLWSINILLPTFVGLFFLPRIKIFIK